MQVRQTDVEFPGEIPNWIGGRQINAASNRWFDKFSPHDGQLICRATQSGSADIDDAVVAARKAQGEWADTPAVRRGELLYDCCNRLEARKKEIAAIVALETGKSFSEALGETGGAIALGRFFAGEGQRLYGRTTTSGQANKYAMTVRQSCGVAGLIIAANTPIANVAWKVFPALICGNSVVLKAAEDAPVTAWIFADMAHETGLPPGLLNVVQGFGQDAGAPLVEHPGVDVISFTGSTAVGRWIAEMAGKRLAKISLELGGKNPLVVCNDANLENAVKWACLSAYSNAGQRCAACSRIIVFQSVYERFRKMFIAETHKMKVGPGDDDDMGPVINEKQLDRMLYSIEAVKERGARVLVGGNRLTDPDHAHGYYMAPTIIEGVDPQDEFSMCELFGPIATLYSARDYSDALALANLPPYGLTASIHTQSVHRATHFVHKVRSGAATINMGTYGSEPHMPFGGVGDSGNGSREPGTEALDVYSELKDIYNLVNIHQL